MNGSRAKGHRGGIRGTKDTRVPSCTPWGRGLEGRARCSEKSYHGSLEKAVRGTRWHFKSTLPPEREFVPASPTVTGGLGPTPHCPANGWPCRRPGGQGSGSQGGCWLSPRGSESSHLGRPIRSLPGPDAIAPPLAPHFVKRLGAHGGANNKPATQRSDQNASEVPAYRALALE